ncbi:hypothetical protein NG895_06570 [Aeoliella sp. ICT_H6.2]|uniref:IncA protein n=1 Tax=Aeoliella straminimaris TaxID=2954799 RepID=A0A9X2FCV8_9BACT|nr:hypothetical protein [Aeoliella straminimaris]MCO6043566.1 hypothetical protein [Aeoliella straminimaris]
MSRASRRDNSTTASLFPFLAVLLCTMGVLVVLLVVMASVQLDQAKRKQLAQQPVAAPPVDEALQAKLRAEMARLDGVAEQFKQRRAEMTEQLQEEQQRLGLVEENIRRRQEQLVMLRAEIDELNSLDEGNTDDVQQATERLARQQELIAEMQQEIESLKQKAEQRGDNYYAIVPYVGPNGVRRQPIFIECRRDSVVFQPENIVLTPEDFNASVAAGGPLVSAIRAAHQYYKAHGLTSQQKSYPLVVARPDAASTLYLTTDMLAKLNIDHGYEIVDEDWQIDYGTANPALAQEMSHAVMNGRMRLAQRREEAPAKFAASQVRSFKPGPNLLDQVRSGKLAGTAMGTSVTSDTATHVSFGNRPLDAREIARLLEASQSRPMESTDASALSQGEGLPNMRGEGPQPDRYAEIDRQQALQQSQMSSGQQGPSQQSSAAMANQSQPNAAMSEDDQSPQAAGSEFSVASNGTSQQPTGATGTAANGNSMQANAKPGNSAGGGAGAPEEGPPGMAMVRTIHVTVSGQQLVVRSGRRTRASTAIPLDVGTKHAAQRFVRAIQAEVADWGIAGQGLYWKPVLDIAVGPGGEEVANSLATYLRQSGVEVRVARLP